MAKRKPQRIALSIAVGSFTGPGRELVYAPGLGERLRTALTGLGYECLGPPETLSGESISAAVEEAIEASGPDDVLVVHLITHAETAARTGSVSVLGSDERPATPVEEWLRSVEDRPGRPLTLFLLDVCHAGEAARPPWQGRVADGTARAWVIGASTPEGAAYDGRLTQAIVNVIGALGRGELDLDAALRHAPFITVARAIGQEVKRLVEAADGYAQQATGSLLDITAIPPDLPFFPNPAYPPSATQRARAGVDAALAPFLDDVDEALDARHFFERAAGGPQVTMGCFSGRAKELRELVPWMQGYGDGRLRVLTGSPGVGKSAILGVLVCAAHTSLREATAEVWKHVEAAPWRIRHLAAVHARKRGPEEITASLARQLGLTGDDLVAGVTALDEVPVIVLDALDEADLPDQVMNGLLLPLAGAVLDDGLPAVRLLVGTRRWGFEPLLDHARTVNGLVDLDEVDREVLYDEIETYVNRLLRANPAYRGRGAVRGAFASDVARSLSAPPRPDEERWGEFLVAGLYSRHFLSGPEITDPVKAADLGGRVPRTLPEVFALDFAEGSEGSAEARSLLTALAYTQGEGMPLALAARAAAALGAPSAAVAGRDRWDAARFYLRRATDVDGTMIYRIFHEGLADHLRSESPAERVIYDAFLAPLDGPRGRRWDLAEPYLLRHSPDHAQAAGRIEDLLGDVEFLIHCDPMAMATIAKITPSPGHLAAWTLLAGLDASPEKRRLALTMAATRSGDAELAARIADSAGTAPLPWRPIWTIEHDVATPSGDGVRLWGRLQRHQGAVNTVAVGRVDGVPVAVTGGEDQTIRLWDISTLSPLKTVKQTGRVTELSVGHDATRALVLFCDANGNLKGGDLTWSAFPRLAPGGVTCAVAAGEQNGEFVAVSGTGGGEVRVWSFREGAFKSRLLGDRHERVESVALGRRPDGTDFVVTGGSAGGILIHDLGSRSFRRLSSSPFSMYTLATGMLDGRSVILTRQHSDQRLCLWDEATDDVLGFLEGHTRPVRAAAIGTVGGRAVAVTGGGDGTVRFWDLRTRTELAAARALGYGDVNAVALGELFGEVAVVAGTQDGSIHVWLLLDAVRPALVGNARLGDVPVVLVRSESRAVSIADLRTGTVLGTVPAGARGAVVGVRTAVIAGQALPILSFTEGSRALWDPSSGLIAVDESFAAAGLPPDPQDQPDPPREATVIRGGTIVRFAGGDDGAVSRTSSGSPESHVIGHHGDRITTLTASRLADRTVLYTAADRTVRVWDVETLRVLDTIEVPGKIRALAADPGGYLLADTGTEVICLVRSSEAPGKG